MGDNDFIRTTADGILENPQKNFPRFLFESDVLSTIELLNEIIVVPHDGHQIVVDCLICWQDLMEHTYGLEPVVSELIHADEPTTAIACLKLINNLLKLSPNAVAKIRIRHELNELQFDDRLLALREKFANNIDLIQELEIWNFLQVNSFSFEEISCRTDADSGTFSGEEDEMVPNPSSADFDPNDRWVEQEMTLRSVIDKFLELLDYDMLAEDRNLIVDNFIELLKLLATKLKSNSLSGPLPLVLGSIKCSLESICTSKTPVLKAPPAAPPPPPPFLLKTPSSRNSNGFSGPPPPPLPLLKTLSAPPPPPPLLFSPRLATSTALPCSITTVPACSIQPQPLVSIPDSLKPKAVPPVGKKFKLLQWTKISETAIACKSTKLNIWQRMEDIDLDQSLRLDFSKLDDYFGSHIYDTTPNTKTSLDKKTVKKMESISLLSSKRSMNISIFLKQFKDVDQLLKNICDGQNDRIDLEKLKMLATLLPDAEECLILRGYTGDIQLLGQAECFLLKLLAINDYKIRIEAMLIREEFGGLIKNVIPQLETIIRAGRELKSSQSLQKVLLVLLHMGNYLNHGANTGNAVGFKLNSLWMIADLRANKGGGVTLLHLIGQQMGNIVNDLKNELSHVKDASGLTLETIRTDVTNIDKRIKTLETQIKNRDDQFSTETMHFLKDAKQDLTTTFEQIQNLELLRKDLAVYFCENEKTFRLEECFKIFNTFLTRFYSTIQEHNNEQEQKKRGKKLRSSSNQSLNMGLDSTTPSDSLNTPILRSNERRSVRGGNNEKIGSKTISYQSTSTTRVRPKESPIDVAKILANDHLEAFVDNELSIREQKKPVGTRPSILHPELWTTNNSSEQHNHKEFEKISVQVSSDTSAYSSDSSPNRRSDSDYGVTSSISPNNDDPTKSHDNNNKVVYTSELAPIRANKSPENSSTTPLVNVPITFDEKSPTKTTTPNGLTRRSTLRSVRTQQSNINDTMKSPPSQNSHKTTPPPSFVKTAQRISMATSMGKVKSMTAKIAKEAEENQVATMFSRKSSDSDSRQSSKSSSNSSKITIQNRTVPRSSIQRSPINALSTPPPTRHSLATKTITQLNLKDPARKSVPMSAVEKRRAMMTKTESVSTASRPSLIKTGSKTGSEQRPKWI